MPDESDLFLSLLRAIVHLDGRSLVLQAGERPFVVTATDRVALGSRELPAEAVNALIEDVLSAQSRATLRASGWVQFALPREPGLDAEHFTVIATGGDPPSMLVQRAVDQNETAEQSKSVSHIDEGLGLPSDDGTWNVPQVPGFGRHDAQRGTPDASTPLPSVASATRPPRFPPLLLLIDDSLDQLDLYELALSDRYQVLAVSDGETGISVAATRQPDVVLVDLSMPRVDGWEVCRRLKGDPMTAAIPIIILTAHDGADIERRVVQSGAVDLLHKPCSIDLLRDRIGAVTRRWST